MLIARKELMLPLLFASTLVLSVGASEDAAAAVGDPDTVTCAYPVWVGFGPVHLANELGYFAEEGITVEEILDDDMPNALAAMERGDIDCYLRTVGEYQGLGRRKDTQGIIIGTIDVSTGGDGWAADRADPVGVRPQGPDHRGRAEPAGAPAAAGGAAARVRSVDPRYQSLGHRRGGCGRRVRQPRRRRGRHLRAGAQSGGRHPPGPRRPHRRLVEGLRRPDPRHRHGAHRRARRRNPDKYVKFLRGIYRAIDYFYAHQEESIPIIAEHFSITPEDFKATLPNFRYTPYEESQAYIGTAEQPGRVYRHLPRRPWRSTWNSAPPTSSCSRRTTSPPTSSRGCRRTGSRLEPAAAR